MPWNFRSPLYDLTEADIDWAEMGRRRYWTRHVVAGWLEVLLFTVASFAVIGLMAHGIKTGSATSFFAGGLISLMGFWPFLRHRIRHGEWPN